MRRKSGCARGFPRRFATLAAVAGCALAGVAACGSSSRHDPSGGAHHVEGVAVSYQAGLAKLLPAALAHGTLRDISYASALPSVGVLNGKPAGWEIDLGQAVAAELGLRFQVKTSLDFSTFIPSIGSGRYNVSFDSYIVKPERLSQVDIIGVFRDATVFATRRDSGPAISTTTDLCGKKVAVIAGSAYIQQLQALSGPCTSGHAAAPSIATFPDQSSAALAVSSGRAQVFATLSDQMGYYIKRSGQQFVEGTLELGSGQVGPAIAKTPGLSEAITAALNRLIQNGIYKKIMAHWGVTRGLVRSATRYHSDA